MSKFLLIIIFVICIFFYFLCIMASWASWVTLQGEELNEDAHGMWDIYLMELTKHRTKMQEFKLYIHKAKPCILFCLAPCACDNPCFLGLKPFS